MTEAMITGFLTGLGLILAIGAQNAFVLRQGLRRSHVGAVVAICALSDALLIGIGVAGFDAATRVIPALAPVLLWAGVAFLATYGTLRLRAAWHGGEALQPAADRPEPLGKVLATCLLLTWANPHVWLDTVVLLGSVSSRHAPWQAAFGLGAATSSLVFFSALGFGARALAPVFARPRAWVWLEAGVGLLMWGLALGLAFS